MCEGSAARTAANGPERLAHRGLGFRHLDDLWRKVDERPRNPSRGAGGATCDTSLCSTGAPAGGAAQESRDPTSSTIAWSTLYVDGTRSLVRATRTRDAGVSASRRSSKRCA
jgi:hypothetical protein